MERLRPDYNPLSGISPGASRRVDGVVGWGVIPPAPPELVPDTPVIDTGLEGVWELGGGAAAAAGGPQRRVGAAVLVEIRSLAGGVVGEAVGVADDDGQIHRSRRRSSGEIGLFCPKVGLFGQG